MAVPRVFVSSTCFDLETIRENLEGFIKSLGYIPVLSNRGNVYYDVVKDVQAACLDEVEFCQMFVLIIGGRFGTEYKNTKKSITNKEFEKALDANIPIFTLIKRRVREELQFWRANKDNKSTKYVSVDDTRIFEFIEEVESAPSNNAFFPFNNYKDIESYLKQQWAGMMFKYISNLSSQIEINTIDEKLSTIVEMNKNIEFITRHVVKALGTDKASIAELKIKIMDMIREKIDISWLIILSEWGIEFTPENFIRYKSLDKLLHSKKINFEKINKEIRIFDPSKRGLSDISETDFKKGKELYNKIRKDIISILEKEKISKEQFLSEK